MKKSAIYLVAAMVFFLATKLTFAQNFNGSNQDDSQMVNQSESNNVDQAPMPDSQGNSNEIYVPVNQDNNSEVTNMPFVPEGNSDNAVTGQGN